MLESPREVCGAIDARVLEHAAELGWTRYIPFLTDEQLREYERSVTAEERAQYEEWFGEQEIHSPSAAAKLISTALFWKNVNVDSPELPEPTLELLENAKQLGLVRRHDPWGHYLQPLLRGAEKLSRTRPDVGIRVYLASDLAFLLPLLTRHCEVRLMKHPSIRYAPGGMWRLLALEDAPGVVTVMDSDMIEQSAEKLLGRSDALAAAGVASWRGVSGRETDARFFIYRPLGGGLYGTRLRLPMRLILEAFVWHSQRGSFPKTVLLPGLGERPYFGSAWPGYGFDEWLLGVALYPRLLAGGFITHAGSTTPPIMYPLDIEMAARANPRSVVIPAG